MKQPSRVMPRVRRRKLGLFGKSMFALVLCAFLYGAYYFISKLPLVVLPLVVAVVICSWCEERLRVQRLLAVAKNRTGQSICDFARDFNVRTVDPWVIRAVYEQLQEYLSDVQSGFPVRAEDVLLKHLIADPDDLELDLIAEIAQRTGRSLENAEVNPYAKDLHVVRHLVMFFNAQPYAVAGSSCST